MSDLRNLQGVSREELAKLRAAGVNSIEDLWERFGAQHEDAPERLAAATGISRARLADMLTGEGVKPPVRADIASVYIIIALLTILAFFLGRVLIINYLWRVDHVAATADAALPSGQIIGPNDVTLQRVPRQEDTFRTLEEVTGHYLLVDVSPEEILTEDQVSKSKSLRQ